MLKATLGKTGITVCKDGFGALPVQRAAVDDAVQILRRARAAGINFFDTARAYTDSEVKLGLAFEGMPREEIYIATKSGALNAEEMAAHLEASLKNLKTEYIDIYQFHNPPFVPRPDGQGAEIYNLAKAAQKAGKIRHIGITNHRLAVAEEAVRSGLFDTLQFPISYISDERELALVELCREHNVGFIGMKALCGGLITDIAAARAYLARFENVVPIWGVQRMGELEQLIGLLDAPAELTDAQTARIEADRAELAKDFCRGCGYCQPCPAGIPIFMAARMPLGLRRMPWQGLVTEEWQANMAKIENCIECGHCKAHCPYGLDTPALLKRALEDYREFVAEHREEIACISRTR